MVIIPTAGWGERSGRSEHLPAPMVTHERSQYAIYGLMLLAPLARSATIRELPPVDGHRVLEVKHPAAPLTRLHFDHSYRLAEARNRVSDAEASASHDQRFIFSSEAVDGPIRWPKSLRIDQDGKPYFELTLRKFQAS